tara:strand:- start:2455 stop:2874 length:420 start_codon:yes stop_codon:yes gene_type:complete
LDAKISPSLVVHFNPSGLVTFPPASLTSKTPDIISHKFKFLCQKASSLLKKTSLEQNNVKTLGIRPESIKLTLENKGDINGIIETIQPTGADWIVGLNVFGKSIFAISSEQPPGNERDKIGLYFKSDGLHAFDNKNQKI